MPDLRADARDGQRGAERTCRFLFESQRDSRGAADNRRCTERAEAVDVGGGGGEEEAEEGVMYVAVKTRICLVT